MTPNELLSNSNSNDLNPSPATSHSDSIGPPLSDFAPLEDAQSDWTPSDASGEHQEEESFDMVASKDWSEGSRGSEPRSGTSSSGDESRMRLSFPDPISSVGNLSSKQSNGDLGSSITDDTAYSFLLDTAPAPSLDSPRSVSSSLPSIDGPLSSIAESDPSPLAKEQPSTPPMTFESERPQLKDRAISDWLKHTGEARAEKEEAEDGKKTAVPETVETPFVLVVEPLVETAPKVLTVVFLGGDESERQIVLNQLERITGAEMEVVTKFQKGSTGLLVNLISHSPLQVEEEEARLLVSEDVLSRIFHIIAPRHSLDTSPVTSTQSSLASLASLASTDSSKTIRGRGDVRLSSFSPSDDKKGSMRPPSGSLLKEICSVKPGSASMVFRLEDLVAADDQRLTEAIKESLLPISGPVAASAERKDDPMCSFNKSVVSRTLLLLTAALAIAAASLLETSPSFGALHSVTQVPPSQQSAVSSSSAVITTSNTQPIASTSILPSPIQSLPAAETPALLDPAPPATACSNAHPGACALAVVEAQQNSLAVRNTKLEGTPSLFGAPNASGKIAEQIEQVGDDEQRRKARTRRIIERNAQRKVIRPRRPIIKPKRKSFHFCSSSSSSTASTSPMVPSVREALHIITHSAHHRAQELAHQLATTHLPRAQRHLHRASSSVQILSRRAEVHLRVGARKAFYQQLVFRQEARKQLNAAAPMMDAFARRGEKKLKEVVRGGEEKIRSLAKVSDQHLHAATLAASRQFSVVAQLAEEKQIPSRLRDSTAWIAEGAMSFGKGHLVRAAGAVEAIQNGEIGLLGDVKGCGTLEGGVRERCEKRKLRERERRRKEKMAVKKGAGEATGRRAEDGGRL